MTGTSLDGLDAALVRIEGRGLAMRAELVRMVRREFGPLAPRLRAAADQVPLTAEAFCSLARDLALLHANALRELRGGDELALACVHGQTIFHRPPLSWQIINAPVIAHALGCPVLSDLRAADLAAGGQGAPITPIADWVLFRAATERTAVVNLGGFVNITRLVGSAGPEAVTGGDLCAANHVLDAVARRTLGVPFDTDGQAARTGTVHDEALDDLLGVFRAQAASGRSLGTGDEIASWIGRQWRGGAGVRGPDLAATACEAIGQTIADATREADLMLLAGGGARNPALVGAIASCATARVDTTESVGVPVEAREAVAFAVLGALCEDRVPITLPAVTGVRGAPIAGVWCRP